MTIPFCTSLLRQRSLQRQPGRGTPAEAPWPKQPGCAFHRIWSVQRSKGKDEALNHPITPSTRQSATMHTATPQADSRQAWLRLAVTLVLMTIGSAGM